MGYQNKLMQSTGGSDGVPHWFAQLGPTWQRKQQYLTRNLLDSFSQKPTNKNKVQILLKIILAGSLSNTILLVAQPAHADLTMPEGWGD